MAEFKTEAPTIKTVEGSFFKPTIDTSGAEAIGQIANFASGMIQLADQKHTQKVVSSFARNLDDIFLDSANKSLSEAGMESLSDNEIRALDTTQGRINLIRKLESNRASMGNLQHRLIAEERKALAANPRLAPEIQQMFRSATGTTSGQLAMDMANDQIGVQIANQVLEMAAPDFERVQQQETETLIRKTYAMNNPDYETQPFEGQAKWYYNFMAEQAKLDALKKQAEAAKASGENTSEKGAQLLFTGLSQVTGNIQRLINTMSPEVLSKLSPEDRITMQKNLMAYAAEFESQMAQNKAVYGTKTADVSLARTLLNGLVDNYMKIANGTVEEDTSTSVLAATQAAFRAAAVGQKDINGTPIGQLLVNVEIASKIPDITASMGKLSPEASRIFDQLELGLYSLIPSIDAYEATFKGMSSKDVQSQMDLLRNLVVKAANDPGFVKDEKAMTALNNIVGSFYVNSINTADKLTEQKIINLGHSATQMLADAKTSAFITSNPVLASSFLSITQKYAQRYAERSAEQAVEVLGAGLEGAVGRVPLSESGITMLDLMDPVYLRDSSMYMVPKFKTPEELRAAVFPIIKEKSKEYLSRDTSVSSPVSRSFNLFMNSPDKTYEEMRANAAKAMFEALQTKTAEFNNKFSTRISKFAKARMNVFGLTGPEEFADAVRTAINANSEYLFRPPVPKASQTQ